MTADEATDAWTRQLLRVGPSVDAVALHTIAVDFVAVAEMVVEEARAASPN